MLCHVRGPVPHPSCSAGSHPSCCAGLARGRAAPQQARSRADDAPVSRSAGADAHRRADTVRRRCSDVWGSPVHAVGRVARTRTHPPQTSDGCWWIGRARLSAQLQFVQVLPIFPGRKRSKDQLVIIETLPVNLARAAQKHDPVKGQPEKYASSVGVTSNPPSVMTRPPGCPGHYPSGDTANPRRMSGSGRPIHPAEAVPPGLSRRGGQRPRRPYRRSGCHLLDPCRHRHRPALHRPARHLRPHLGPRSPSAAARSGLQSPPVGLR